MIRRIFILALAPMTNGPATMAFEGEITSGDMAQMFSAQ